MYPKNWCGNFYIFSQKIMGTGPFLVLLKSMNLNQEWFWEFCGIQNPGILSRFLRVWALGLGFFKSINMIITSLIMIKDMLLSIWTLYNNYILWKINQKNYLIDEWFLISIGKQFPFSSKPFWNFRIMHFWVFSGHFSSLPTRPNLDFNLSEKLFFTPVKFAGFQTILIASWLWSSRE